MQDNCTGVHHLSGFATLHEISGEGERGRVVRMRVRRASKLGLEGTMVAVVGSFDNAKFGVFFFFSFMSTGLRFFYFRCT